MSQLDPIEQDDVGAITAWGVNRDARDIKVAVHLVEGRLAELEIWGGWDGGEVQTQLPSVESLRTERPA